MIAILEHNSFNYHTKNDRSGTAKDGIIENEVLKMGLAYDI